MQKNVKIRRWFKRRNEGELAYNALTKKVVENYILIKSTSLA